MRLCRHRRTILPAWLPLSIVFFTGLVHAQKLAATPSAPQASEPGSYPAEPYVFQTLSTVVTMHADGTGTRLYTVSMRIQSESARRNFSVLSLSYPRLSESAEFLYARVLHPDGTVQQTPVSDSIEQPAPVTQAAPLYSDLEIRQLPVKDLRVGDTLEWQGRSTIQHPEIPNQFWGQDTVATNAVCLRETFELRTPLASHLTVWTNPRANTLFAETTSATERVSTWTHSSLDPTVGPKADQERDLRAKHMLTSEEELDLTKGALPSFAYTTFPDWAAVGAWYRSLSVGRVEPDTAIRAKVAELTAGKSTDLAKAQALYDYVSGNIRYIGIDFGIGRFQPHSAAEVFANQYGDCKDKHTLLAAMLAAAGLHADPVLIGAGIRFNPAVPSPAAFNHVITHLTLNGQETWLDATAELSPWRALIPLIRDQQALLVSAAPVIDRTPADLPYASSSVATITGSLDSSLTSDSEITLTFHDDAEIVLRAILRSVSPADYGAFAQNLMANFGFGGTTSDPVFDHLADSTQPFAIRFHYHRVRDSSWSENQITATFLPISLPAFSPEKPPTAAIQLGTPRTEASTVEIALPPGWHVNLPEAVHAHTAFATCDVTFRIQDGKLFEERRLTVLQSKLPATDYQQYETWYTASGASSVPFIQLVPPSTDKVSSSSSQISKPDGTATARKPASESNTLPLQ